MHLSKTLSLNQVHTTYAPHIVDLANLFGMDQGVIYLDAKHLYLDYAFFGNSRVKLHSVRNPQTIHILVSEKIFTELLIDIAANIPIRECLHKLNNAID